MQILTAAEMAATDRRTSEESGIALSTLMENAGTAVARFCIRNYPHAENITVLCGKGNNGGDGFVAARILAKTNLQVKVLLLGREDEVRGEAEGALNRLRTEATNVELLSLSEESRIDQHTGLLAWADLVIDAVVGTGFKPPLRGLPAKLKNMLDASAVPVVAVDLPSGWDADSMQLNQENGFPADSVVTFTRPKIAHAFGHLTKRTGGPVVVADIGSPADAVFSEAKLTWCGGSKSIAEKPREVNANKGKYGHVLVVGGSYGTSGAPAMASLAALRTGAGLVTAAVPASIVDAVAQIAPELMMAPLQQGAEGEISLSNLETGTFNEVIRQKRISVIAIGPGMSTRGDAASVARELVNKTKLPLVLDADGLNAFRDHSSELNGKDRTLVLTPHPGEMARLMGISVKEVEADRITVARRFAAEHHLTLVLKGWRTLVAHPDGRVSVNTSGNPAMAKGGSGDILTGIIAGMLAQYGEDVAKAIEGAVYLHGLAGDFAAQAKDEHTVLATDTLDHLSDAFRYRAVQDGLMWICGVHA